ncbi:hypothetical protein VNI00_014922 [Paramarasmius palmivorus]|uniref:Uncharacterized protein n=1 Tax=Paramarasmius palmivorus TaxID=297713 RepID=A0AAW0BNA7_9AGAR
MIDMTSRLSSEPKPAPTPSIIGASTTAFVSSRQCYTSTLNDWGNRPIRFIGDNQGWLYSYIDPPQTVWEQSPVEVLSEINLHPHGEVRPSMHQVLNFIDCRKAVVNLPVRKSLHVRIRLLFYPIPLKNLSATCFGPTTRISVQSLHEPSRTTIITLPSVHDVRCSTILPSSAHVLGAAKRAIHINSPEIRHGIRELHTGSDVFSLCNIEEDIIYAGCRNGQISRFDLRITGSKPDALRLPVSKSTPIYLSLLPIPKWEILVGRMDGELCTYDLRFVSTTSETTPTRTFRGHVGGVDHRLGSGISVPPDSEYIFAAGDDGRLRCWSLRAAGMDPQTTVECGRLRCLHTTQEDVEGSTGNQLWGVDTSETRRGIVNWLL